MSDKNQKIAGTAPASIAPVSIDIDAGAKARLDHIKQAQGLQTDSEAIVFLYASWKKNFPSMAGAFPGIGSFEREEDDPYRYPDEKNMRGAV
jgi:hypothetical protein